MPRATTILLALSLSVAALGGPASAQVQQGNPNAADRALANEGQMRAMEQNQTSQGNTTQMNIERSQNMTPPPPGGGLPGGVAAPGGVR